MLAQPRGIVSLRSPVNAGFMQPGCGQSGLPDHAAIGCETVSNWFVHVDAFASLGLGAMTPIRCWLFVFEDRGCLSRFTHRGAIGYARHESYLNRRRRVPAT